MLDIFFSLATLTPTDEPKKVTIKHVKVTKAIINQSTPISMGISNIETEV
jgi:hypothetical protein